MRIEPAARFLPLSLIPVSQAGVACNPGASNPAGTDQSDSYACKSLAGRLYDRRMHLLTILFGSMLR